MRPRRPPLSNLFSRGAKGLERSAVNSVLALANEETEAKRERVARIARVFPPYHARLPLSGRANIVYSQGDFIF